MTSLGEVKQEMTARAWMYETFCLKSHSSSASSTMKLQFGGTLGGGLVGLCVVVKGKRGIHVLIGLDRREVCSYYCGRWILIGYNIFS
jgi:hypothetical protein